MEFIISDTQAQEVLNYVVGTTGNAGAAVRVVDILRGLKPRPNVRIPENKPQDKKE